MAVITTGNRGGGILGALGQIANIGGMLTGTPWLSGLGMGMNAVNGAMNGGTSAGQFGGAGLNNLMEMLVNGRINGGFFDPSSNNIARTAEQNAAANMAANMQDAAQLEPWRRAYFGGGVY